MKITEISELILNALREKEFIGYFDVTIYRHGTEYAKIKGFKQNSASFPYDFNCELQNKINEICFKIVFGAISDCGFTFDIAGQIEYSYKRVE